MTATTVRRPPRNGVDVPTLFATLDAVKGAPQIRRVPVPHNQRMDQRNPQPFRHPSFCLRRGPGGHFSRTAPFTYDADHPEVLVGTNHGPTPVGFLLHAIAGCRASGLATSPPLGNDAAGGCPRRLKATSTCSASSGCRMTVRNGYRRSGCTSTSRATRRRKSWQRSSSGPADDRPSTTCSSTAPMSRSTFVRLRPAPGPLRPHLPPSSLPCRPGRTASPAGTRSSSAPGSPARRPRCCSLAPGCGCWSSIVPAAARTRCRPTR